MVVHSKVCRARREFIIASACWWGWWTVARVVWYLPTITFAFRSNEVNRLVLDLAPYLSTDILGMFPLFLKITATGLASGLSIVFRRLVRLGSFPASGLQANVNEFRKVHRPHVANYKPSTITLVLSKVFEHVGSVRLRGFMECSGVIPTIQFAN